MRAQDRSARAGGRAGKGLRRALEGCLHALSLGAVYAACRSRHRLRSSQNWRILVARPRECRHPLVPMSDHPASEPEVHRDADSGRHSMRDPLKRQAQIGQFWLTTKRCGSFFKPSAKPWPARRRAPVFATYITLGVRLIPGPDRCGSVIPQVSLRKSTY
jgi:hypothetical protein